MALRLVMMGTGQFALPTLRGLLDSKHFVAAVFTQPDRSGRGHHRHKNAVKEFALDREVPVFQPQSINSPDGLKTLRLLRPHLCVTAAYGQILSEKAIAVPRLGVVNVHASLLPKYRGAAPVAHAILQGEAKTGVTIFQIEPKLDAGPILGTAETEIGAKETAGELERRLSEMAVPLLLRVLDEIESGSAQPVLQDASMATPAPRLKKSTGAVDWTQSAEDIERHVRAMQPWPTAFTFLRQPGKRPRRLILLDVDPAHTHTTAEPGTLTVVDGSRLLAACGDGNLEIHALQPSGKCAMRAENFLRGYHVQSGDRFLASDTSNSEVG